MTKKQTPIDTRARGIYVVSPSSAVADAKVLTRGVKRLEKMGFKVALDRETLAREQRFAGSDQARLSGLHRAAKQSLPIVMASRGCCRISIGG